MVAAEAFGVLGLLLLEAAGSWDGADSDAHVWLLSEDNALVGEKFSAADVEDSETETSGLVSLRKRP